MNLGKDKWLLWRGIREGLKGRERRGRRRDRGSELKLCIKVFRINKEGRIRKGRVKVVVGYSKGNVRVVKMNRGRGKGDLVMSKTNCG